MDNLGTSRILIVDDDVDLTVMLGQYLQAEGLQIEIVHNGEDALPAPGNLMQSFST